MRESRQGLHGKGDAPSGRRAGEGISLLPVWVWSGVFVISLDVPLISGRARLVLERLCEAPLWRVHYLIVVEAICVCMFVMYFSKYV